MICKLFNRLDIFKTPIYFNIKGESLLKTNFGALVSFPIIVFILISLFLSDLVRKTNPKINTQSVAIDGRPFMFFDKNNMTLSIKISDEYDVPIIDPSIFTFKITNIKLNVSSKEEIFRDDKELKICEKSDFIDENQFAEVGLSNATCLVNQSFEIGGYWSEKIVSYFTVSMLKCKNNTNSNIICKSEAEIKEFFSTNKYISFNFHEYNFDLNNYKNPFKKLYEHKHHLIEYQIRKRLYIYMKKITFQNDDTLVFEQEESSNYFKAGYYENDFTMDSADVLSEVYIFSSLETEVMKRRYQKVQELLASLGGSLNSLIIIGFFLVSVQKKYYLTNKIVNKLYSFPENKTDLIKKTHHSKEKIQSFIDLNKESNNIKSISLSKDKIFSNDNNNNLKFISISKPVSLEKISVTNQEKQNNKKINAQNNYLQPKYISSNEDPDPNISDILFLDKVKEDDDNKSTLNENKLKLKNLTINIEKTTVVKRRKSDIKKQEFHNFAEYQKNEKKVNNKLFSFWDYLKIKLNSVFRFFRLNHNQMLFKKACKIAGKDLSVFRILKKLKEIDKLKAILLSSDQIKLFDLLSKPMITSNKLKENIDLKDNSFRLSKLIDSSKFKNHTNTKQIVIYYNELKKKLKLSEVEERLLKLIDNTFEKYSQIRSMKDLNN